jgi:gamma-glutamyltranspeptidase
MAKSESISLLAEAERRALRRRNALLGDPAFVKIPVASFMSGDTAAALLARSAARHRGSGRR